MTDHINAEDDIIICLRSMHKSNIYMDQLQSDGDGIDVYQFDDVDECVEYFLTLNPEDVFVFLWLGFGWNHLIPIVYDFEQVRCVYLSEPVHLKDTSKVHGVFTDAEDLLKQIETDIRICHRDLSTHLTMLNDEEMSTIHNPQGNAIRSLWSEILLQGLIRMPAPSTDVYREMIKEARFFHRKNLAQLQQIDDFEKHYRAEEAIRWYSRDSFIYRPVNKALRIQNLAILFKFRFFIRDMCEQLKKLYLQQYFNEQAKSKEPSTVRMYRAMKVSSTEYSRLRSCAPGTIISISSFVSTSCNPDVAVSYLGNDLERDIMLEIEIDIKSLNSDVLPFADIHTFSAMPDEDEVLLSMGTTLIVESVTANPQYKNICVKTKLRYDLDPQMRELKTFILDIQLRCGESEEFYVDALICLLIATDRQKAKEVFKLCKSGRGCIMKEFSDLSDQMLDSLIPSTLTVDTSGNALTGLFTRTAEIFQNINATANLSKNSQDFISSVREDFHDIASLCNGIDNIDDFEQLLMPLTRCIPSAQSWLNSLPIGFPSLHPIQHQMQLMISMRNVLESNSTGTLSRFETSQTSPIAAIMHNDCLLTFLLTDVLQHKNVLNINAPLIENSENCQTLRKPQIYEVFNLANKYDLQKDWPLAIGYYQNIIQSYDLPPNSLMLVDLYYRIGLCFAEMYERELAMFNYQKAQHLLEQHHPPTHPLYDDVKLAIRKLQLGIQLQQLRQQLTSFINYFES
ncbi:unnamed protein product [Adineta ricciae]|uniref:ADP ribosyltransferase domain-containing protein n=1 Tax=Adineta ricciae TaxID=249248 RepID=A0A815MWH1_ADIRI|nr:unnamed protein product [Adineta ricciae]